MITRGGELISQVMIQWSNVAEELATWEDTKALLARFSVAPAWAQASFQVGTPTSATTMTRHQLSTIVTYWIGTHGNVV